MILDEILLNNKEFVENFEVVNLSHLPQKKLAIVTCMDTRLVGFLEPALGIERGDAKVIKNAGNNVIDSDVIRSVAAAIFSLGVEEVMLIGHKNCGMANADVNKLKASMIEKGIDPEEIAKVDLKEWIGAIEDEESNVLNGVEKIKNSPLIPETVPIHGLIIDPTTGSLDVLINGYK
ncbi:beta-carbonic anhydrase 1 [Methanobrevibacter cuticularis]|uniref:Beta-carbonic anhydrase 1 n=2 Tax=Methanobrevibacter cuticularis TaxID=47311 RepID=A0A166EK30_9EURY|nr:beta-carbonic anhydrase 1 [Methanobrevibacter cuticularis]